MLKSWDHSGRLVLVLSSHLIWLYEKARRLQDIYPEYRNNFVFRIGELYTVRCGLRVIGSSIEGRSIDNASVASKIYGPNTVQQILEGKHFKRAVNAHIATLIALSNLHLEYIHREQSNIFDPVNTQIDLLLEASSQAVTLG